MSGSCPAKRLSRTLTRWQNKISPPAKRSTHNASVQPYEQSKGKQGGQKPSSQALKYWFARTSKGLDLCGVRSAGTSQKLLRWKTITMLARWNVRFRDSSTLDAQVLGTLMRRIIWNLTGD